MTQLTFATTGFEPYRKTTRREVFLAEMNQVVPWEDLCAVIEPVYPNPPARAAGPWASNGWCASISCNSGSICPIQPWRRRCTTRRPCGPSWALTWAGSRSRMNPRFAGFVTGSKPISSA